MHCIEENDLTDFYSINRTYDCIDEKSPYLVIVHSKDRFRTGYYRDNSKTVYLCTYITKDLFTTNTLIETTSKEEIKIWMDLNGYKMIEKVVVYYSGSKKIHLDMFKLKKN